MKLEVIKMRKAIVTGANGFVGSYLVKELIKNNVEVVSIVRNVNSNLELLPKSDNNKIIYCDLIKAKDLTKLISDRDFDVFYHLAWQGSAGQYRTDEILQTNNAIWTGDCVRIAKELGCKKFVGSGSIMEIETISAIYTDDNKPGLGYIYGTGKLAAHCISKAVAANVGIDYIWAMITNAYGPGESSPRFINTTLRKIINNEPLQFTSATQNYDFIYITDVAKAFFHLGLQGKSFNSYIIGSGNAKQLKQFIFELQKEFAPKTSIHFGDIPFSGVNLPIECFNIEKLSSDTNFKPRVTFKEGLNFTMTWLKETEF